MHFFVISEYKMLTRRKKEDIPLPKLTEYVTFRQWDVFLFSSCNMMYKGGYTLQKIFHGTENLPRTACAVRFFLKKKSYCACGPRKIFRSVENFLKCISTLTTYFGSSVMATHTSTERTEPHVRS